MRNDIVATKRHTLIMVLWIVCALCVHVLVVLCENENISYCPGSGNGCCENYYRENGVCVICPDGWYSENCTAQCPRSKYGQLCLKECPLDCNTSCHHIYGCQQGDWSVTSLSPDNTSIPSGGVVLTQMIWIILGSANGVVITTCLIGVAVKLCQKSERKTSWEPTLSTYNDEHHLNEHFSCSVPKQNDRISIQNSQTYMDINDTNLMTNVSIKNDPIDMQINHATVPSEDNISGTYIEETDFNTNHYSPTKRKFTSFKTNVKNVTDIQADIDEKYTTACKLNGMTSQITNSTVFNEEDNAYFVLESQDKACDDNFDTTMSLENLPPPRFSVFGEL